MMPQDQRFGNLEGHDETSLGSLHMKLAGVFRLWGLFMHANVMHRSTPSQAKSQMWDHWVRLSVLWVLVRSA